MRDILFKRYSDVSFLLLSMSLEETYEFISFAVSQDVEDKLWQLYLSIPFKEKTFEEFKADTSNGSSIEGRDTITKQQNVEAVSKELNLVFSMLGGVVDGN